VSETAGQSLSLGIDLKSVVPEQIRNGIGSRRIDAGTGSVVGSEPGLDGGNSVFGEGGRVNRDHNSGEDDDKSEEESDEACHR
jgi:hypothetical protein